MIFNQPTSYVEDVLKSYILNEILLVATSINFYSLCYNLYKFLHFQTKFILSNSFYQFIKLFLFAQFNDFVN